MEWAELTLVSIVILLEIIGSQCIMVMMMVFVMGMVAVMDIIR
jgi:hypothetical protein